jgi:hypothetical protein
MIDLATITAALARDRVTEQFTDRRVRRRPASRRAGNGRSTA